MAALKISAALTFNCLATDPQVGTCGDGVATCDEVCCFNGATNAMCCSFQYPICDLPNWSCHSSSAEADFVAAMTAKLSNTIERVPLEDAVELEMSTCGDGVTYCDEVCCFNGATNAMCCSFQYPICDLPNWSCHSGSAEADFVAAMTATPSKAIEGLPLQEVVVPELKVSTCGDGVTYCDEVCCFNGATNAMCCSFQYPICDLPNWSCHSSSAEADFVAAMTAKSSKAIESLPLEEVVPELEMSTCGDGVTYCDEVCCFNGATNAMCCSFQYPICDLPNWSCHSSSAEADFVAAMTAKLSKAAGSLPLQEAVAPQLQVSTCGDGVTYCDEVCCFNGATNAMCCSFQYPICDLPNWSCHSSSAEADFVAAMTAKPLKAIESLPLQEAVVPELQVSTCGDGVTYCDEVCCFNGATNAMCCSFQYPICDLPNWSCHSSSAEADFVAAMTAKPSKAMESFPLQEAVVPEFKVSTCGDGVTYCDEVCCFNGATNAMCCSFQYPICDLPNWSCHSSSTKSEFVAAMTANSTIFVV